MSKLRKWWKSGLAIVLAVVALQMAMSFLVRTHRVHTYLTARLERAFGRPVEVRSFDARIFPNLQLYADGVTVGEDPAFGYEYFLRAEHLSAGLRWKGDRKSTRLNSSHLGTSYAVICLQRQMRSR